MASRDKPGFFYEGGGRSEVLEQIHHHVRLDPGVIALTGPTGSGRSLVLHKFSGSINTNNIDLCFLSDDSVVLETEEELFRALAEGFGLEQKPIEIVEDLVDRVEHFIELGLNHKRSMLIIVDDAKQHTDVVFETLMQLAVEFKGLSLLFSGESSWIDKLHQADAQLGHIQQINLRPLLLEEALDFVRGYLQHQGLAAEPLLQHIKPNELLVNTGGNLCLLMREAQQLMSVSRASVGRFQSAWPVVHTTAFVAVCLITALAFFYYPEERDTKAVPVAGVDTQVVAMDRVGLDASAAGKTQAIEHEEQIMDGQALPLPTSPSETRSQVMANESPAAAVANSGPEVALYSVQEQALLNRPASNLTLQVMNLSSEQVLKDVIEQSGITDTDLLSYYRRGADAKVSYVLLYGNYPDKQSAMAAQESLPAAFKDSAPWPRVMQDIQRELQKRQQ